MLKYRFDQIAINSTAKKKPVEEDKYSYIGLEHLDSENLIVSRWGSEVAPKGEKLLMKKGDVLFGKRRAYQKKVAIAPFDGIFSAHGMVLRPNEDVVDKRFFPMFISSDYFLDAAIAISVGSLSPTINWRDLAKLEFDLPPLDEQKKLAEVLWAINDTLQAYQKLLRETDELVKSQFIEMFGDEKNCVRLEGSIRGRYSSYSNRKCWRR
jgi:type I restriction enzyme S subunit